MASKEYYIEELRRVLQPISVLSEDREKKVVLAQHKKTGDKVVIRSQTKKQPLYRLLSTVTHPNLPEVYDVYDHDTGEIVLLEYVQGVSVAEVLETGLYTYTGAKRVLAGACRALTFLHDRGWVHRDVKPENILITDKGGVVLIDFDAARQFDTQKSGDTTVLGTVGFAPPEQFGIAQSDPRSDIYALGVLLNVMLTGTHPSDNIAKGKAGAIVRRCTQIHPRDRFQTAEELRQRL